MKLKYVLRFFLAFLPIAVIMRVVELRVMVEPTTGFCYPNLVVAEGVLLAGYFAIAVVLLMMARIAPRHPLELPERNFGLALASVIVSLAMVVELFRMVIGQPQGDITFFLELLLLLISAVSMLLQGLHLLGFVPLVKELTVFPVLWSCLRLGLSFMKYTGIAKIPENLLDVGMLCMFLCFWLFHGRFWGGVNMRKAAGWVYGFAMASSVFGMLCTLPRWIATWMGVTLHGASTPGMLDFIVSIYGAVFCFTAVGQMERLQRRNARRQRIMPQIEPLDFSVKPTGPVEGGSSEIDGSVSSSQDLPTSLEE